jgi:deoxyribodipyrimidine photolyase
MLCLTRTLCRWHLAPPSRQQGLRLHDNPALVEACKGASSVYNVFVIDPHFLQSSSYK